MAKGNEYEQPIEKLFNNEEFQSMPSDSPKQKFSSPKDYKNKFCQRSGVTSDVPNSNNTLKNMLAGQTKDKKKLLNSLINKNDIQPEKKKGIFAKLLEKVGLGKKDQKDTKVLPSGVAKENLQADVDKNNKYVMGALGKALKDGQNQKDSENQEGFMKSIMGLINPKKSVEPRQEINVAASRPESKIRSEQVTSKTVNAAPQNQHEIDMKTISSLVGLVIFLVAVLAFQMMFPDS